MANWLPSILTSQAQDRSQIPSIPPASALQLQRQKQIESLLQYNFNITEIAKSTDYRIILTSNNVKFQLNIYLSPQFPDDKPKITIFPPCRHPWINEQMMITGCPAINGFMVHSSLGVAMQQVVKEFQERPPQPYQQSHQGQTLTDIPGGYNNNYPAPTLPDTNVQMPRSINTGDNDIPFPQPALFKSNTYSKPEIQSKFPKLRSYSTSELQDLRSNDKAIDKLVQDLDEVQKVKEDQERILKDCAEIARMNLAKAPELESRRQKLIEMYINRDEHQKKLDAAFEKQREHLQRYSVDAIYTNLRVATAEADEKSEDLAEKFLDSKVGIDVFLQQFMDLRKISHSRRIKMERIMQDHGL